MPVSELRWRVPSSEITSWMAYAEIEPFGYHMDNHRAGVVAASVVGVHISKGKRPAPKDFFPAAKKRQSLDDFRSYLKAINGNRKHSRN